MKKYLDHLEVGDKLRCRDGQNSLLLEGKVYELRKICPHGKFYLKGIHRMSFSRRHFEEYHPTLMERLWSKL